MDSLVDLQIQRGSPAARITAGEIVVSNCVYQVHVIAHPSFCGDWLFQIDQE